MKKTNKLLLLWYSHPRVAIALALVAINLAVIFSFTAILSLLSGTPFFSELAYLFTYTMCSDGIYDFVNNQEDVACFVVKIILTIIQMIIFSGALIGFTTDILQKTFDKRLDNKDKLFLRNHYVFLNWSTIGQNIIYDLSFLEGEKTIVILSDANREDILTSIDNIFIANKRSKRGLRIFVKSGNPTSMKHLSDISIENARYVGILLTNHFNESDITVSTNDLISFKLLLSLLGIAPNANIVVETESERTKQKIEQLIDNTYQNIKDRVSIFSHDSIIGHMLGRTVIMPSFSRFMHDILSFDGVELYKVPVMPIDEALQTFNDCIPIINYDDDDICDKYGSKKADSLYVLSDDEYSLGYRKKQKKFIIPLNYSENICIENFTLFIISKSNRAEFVIDELENYNKRYSSEINYHIFSYVDDINEIIKLICDTDGKKKILLLSEDGDSAETQDANVFLALLELKRNHTIRKEVEIFVEIVNLNNVIPVRNLGIATVILSNKIISLFMLQLLTHQGSRKFYRDLLTSNSNDGDIDFEIIKANQLLVFEDSTLKFSCFAELVQSFYIASKKAKMLIGYIPSSSSEGKIVYFCNEMDDPVDIEITPNDKLVVVSYF